MSDTISSGGFSSASAYCWSRVEVGRRPLWGSLVDDARLQRRHGSIPACAGKPHRPHRRQPSIGVHPRVCGEAACPSPQMTAQEGPSPRVCGEAAAIIPEGMNIEGPSPRVRGSPVVAYTTVQSSGSIPACAGPGSIPACAGEAGNAASAFAFSTGPSPRVRGKPGAKRSGLSPARVHPRVCGEAVTTVSFAAIACGPSPRVRGSQLARLTPRCRLGSIPACAGKPGCRFPRSRCRRVHPRVCGEALNAALNTIKGQGPSPRVRGSHKVGDAIKDGDGSIPACAGKPRTACRCAPTSQVHPRVCGEASVVPPFATQRMGPSPRVRGSRRHPDAVPLEAGSIPACAGKPGQLMLSTTRLRVHPRVCGGSRRPKAERQRLRGSIPACAGKPSVAGWWRQTSRVHPRVCGGSPGRRS